MPTSRRVHLCLLLLLPTLILACGGPATQEEAPAARQISQYTIEDFLDTTTLAGGSLSPDGSKVLVSSDESGIFNAYAVPTDGGEPVPLTDSAADSVWVLGYFPEDERFLYQSDQGGNELDHIYVHELDGSATDLTPGDGHKAVFYGWAHDETSFFVGTNERDEKFFDVYEIQVADFSRERIYQNDTGLQPAAISPDRRWLAFNKPRTTYDSDIFLYDRESGEMKNLTAHEGDVANRAQDFHPDGKSLFYLTDEGAEFTYLVRLDLATGELTEVLRPEWDVAYAGFSRGGSRLVAGINADARTEIRLFDAATLEPVALPELPEANITSVRFSRDDHRMVFYAESSRSPDDLWIQDLGGDTPPRQLTHNLPETIDPRDLVEAQGVRFASFDGVEIPGLLYRPHQATPEAPVPALVWVHGGPGGQSRVGYSPLIQYLVNHGYAVYAINNRGSSGYGKTFFRMDDKKHGSADLDDCVASKKMLTATGWVDGEKIGIAGGSYGGYMVLAALTLRPEAFAAGVDLFGISNWVRTLESIPPWWQSFRDALYLEMGNPETDREYLRSISPLFHAEQIRRPLMVLQGANDPRVLKAESDDIVAAARANGVPVEYLVFDDEGHGFEKKENRAEGYRAIRVFLDKYLKGEEVPEVAETPPTT
jgi:dipeptidyl aminopeptidase/acylaminoacyl peptidase